MKLTQVNFNPFDEEDSRLTPVSHNPFENQPESTTAKPADSGSLGGDLAASFGVGSNQLLGAIGSVYGLVTGDMDNAAKRQADSGIDFYSKMKSPVLESQQAERAKAIAGADGFLDQAGEAVWHTVTNPRLFASFLAEQIPLTVAAGGAGRAAAVGSKMAGAGTKAAGVVGTEAAIGTGAALQGASVGDDVFSDLKNMPQQVWEKNPEYNALKTDIGSEQAKQELSMKYARDAAIASGAISIGSQFIPGGATIEKVLSRGKGAVPGGLVSRVAKGFLGEAGQEAIEEGGGSLMGNIAKGQIDPDTELTEGLGESVGLGVLGGGVMGGIAGIPGAPKTALSSEEKQAKIEQAKVDTIARGGSELDAELAGANASLDLETGDIDQFLNDDTDIGPVNLDEPMAATGNIGAVDADQAIDMPLPEYNQPPLAEVTELSEELDAYAPAEPLPEMDVVEQAAPIPAPEVTELTQDEADLAQADYATTLDPILTASGKPFKSEKMALTSAKQKGIYGASAVPIGDGYGYVAEPEKIAASKDSEKEIARRDYDREAAMELASQEADTAALDKAVALTGDPRASIEANISYLPTLSSELVSDQGVGSLIRDQDGTPSGRVKSANPSWFKDNEDIRLPGDVKRVADKVAAGKKLGPYERRVLGYMLDEIDSRVAPNGSDEFYNRESQADEASFLASVDPADPTPIDNWVPPFIRPLMNDRLSPGEKSEIAVWNYARNIGVPEPELIAIAEASTTAEELTKNVYERAATEARRNAPVPNREDNSGIEGIAEKQNQSTAGQAGGEGQVAPSDFSLETYTEQDLQARADSDKAAQQAAQATEQQAEQKASADTEVNDFRLSGSNSAADVAVAGGQDALFGQSQPIESDNQTDSPSTEGPQTSTAKAASSRPYATLEDRNNAVDRLRGDAPDWAYRSIVEAAEYGASETEIERALEAAYEDDGQALDDLIEEKAEANKGLKQGFGEATKPDAAYRNAEPSTHPIDTDRYKALTALSDADLKKVARAAGASVGRNLSRTAIVDRIDAQPISDVRRAYDEVAVKPVEQPVLTASGKPFKTEKLALTSAKQKGVANAKAVEVDGGWGYESRADQETKAPQVEALGEDKAESAPVDQEIEPTAKPLTLTGDDLDASKITSAYSHSVRNVRGMVEVEKKSYTGFIDGLREDLASDLPEGKQAELDAALNEVAAEYIRRRDVVLNARSGVVSGHIAGRSNFNSRQASNRGNALDRAESDFSQWLKTATRGVADDLGVSSIRGARAAAMAEKRAKAQAEAAVKLKAMDKAESDRKRKLPIINEPTAGITMTKAEWSKTPKDYKSISAADGFRYRSVMREGGTKTVYISDQKTVLEPKADTAIEQAPKAEASQQADIMPSLPADGYTVDHHKAVLEAIAENGSAVSVKSVRDAFESMVADTDAVKKQLAKLTIKQLTPIARPPYNGEKKARLVDMAVKKLITDYEWLTVHEAFMTSTGGYDLESKIKGARERLDGLTAEDLQQYSDDRKAAIEERKQRIEAIGKALKNPETLEEFETFIEYKGKDKFTPDQLRQYDALKAGKTIEEMDAEKAAKAVKAGLEVDGELEINPIEESVHGKTGEPIFNVNLQTRLGKDKFKEAAGMARSMKGGYYRGNFYFKSMEDAELFTGWLQGETVDNSEKAAERDADKQDRRVTKLRDLAAKLESQGEAKLSADRNTNTARRASMAASAEADAAKKIEFARVLHQVADAVEKGEAPFLAGLSASTQLGELRSIQRLAIPADLKNDPNYDGYSIRGGELKPGVTIDDYVGNVEFPTYSVHSENLADIAKDMASVPGLKQLAQKYSRIAAGTNGDKLTLPADEVAKIKAKVGTMHTNRYGRREKYAMPWQLENKVAQIGRLERMGISTSEHLRAAIRELDALDQGIEKVKVDPLKAKERELVGKKIPGFFPTPDAVVQRLMEEAGIEPGMKVLEPSAGKGDIADAIKEIAPEAELDIVEYNSSLADLLEAKGYNLAGNDFLEHGGEYDRIVMNPPFEKNADIEHVRHAFSLLKPGGRLVAITSGPAGHRQDATNKGFKEWVDGLGGTMEPLPDGSFKSSFRPTGVSTQLVVIEKPELLYSRTAEVAADAKPKGVARGTAQLAVNRFLKQYKGADDVNIVIAKNYEDAFGQQAEFRTKGGYSPKTDTLYLFTESLDSVADLNETLRHEILVHKGLGMVEPTRLKQLLDTFSKAAKDSRELTEIVDEVNRVEEGRSDRLKAEEIIARIAQEKPSLTDKVWNRIVLAVQRMLNSVGLGEISAYRRGKELVYQIGDAFIEGKRAARRTDADGVMNQAVAEDSGPESSIWKAAVAKGLDMSKEARMQRARDMGFDTDTVYYHGTKSRNIKEFSASKSVGRQGEDDQITGIYLTPDRAGAESFMLNEDDPRYLYEVFSALKKPYKVKNKNKLKFEMGVNTLAEVEGELRSRGYDGVEIESGFYSMGGPWIEHIVFDPSSIRSVNAAFDPDHADSDKLLFSRSDDNFVVPAEKRLQDTFIRKMQDKFQPLKRTQKAIKEFGGAIGEQSDVYLAEEAFYGKTENDLNKLEKSLIQPLVDAMSDRDVSQEELDLYLIAKHAKERNAHIATINNDLPDGGSGMTNAEADKVIAGFTKEGRLSDLEAVAAGVYKILSVRRKILKVAGLSTDAEVDAWDEQYEFYVPLKGFSEDAEGSSRAKVGSGFDIRGKETMKALGRRSMAESPTMHAIQDLTASAIRRRKNEVGLTLLQLVRDNPNAAYWEVFSEDNPDTTRRNVDGQVQEVPIWNMGAMKDDYFAVKKEGKEYFIKLKDPLVMNAMKNLGPEPMAAWVRTAGTITRFLSAVNTSYNPEFMISNMSRDIQTALYNALAEQGIADGKVKGKKLALKMVKGVPQAVRAIWADSREKTAGGKAAEYQKFYKEFLEDGAKTGYFDSKDIDGIAKDISQLLSMSKGGAVGNLLKAKKKIGDFVENGNGAIENGVRLSAYMEARKSGISRKQAASFAKNLTVNFNRRGEVGATLNSLYIFANASAQGTANFARAIAILAESEKGASWTNLGTGKKLNNAQKAAGVMMGAAFALSVLNRSMSDDDDDDINLYDKVPDYVRERNIVIMKSVFGGPQGEYWAIPLPYGYNIFYNLGDSMEGAAFSKSSKRKDGLGLGLAMSAVGSFSPIGAHKGELHEALIMTGVPTVALPAVEISFNTNFFGSDIARENYAYGPQKSDANMSMRSTKQIYKNVAEFLNDATGGSVYKSGAIDISPDTLEHMAEFGFGGLYKLVDRTIESVDAKMDGRELDVRNIPFRRKVDGKITPYQDISAFYDARQEVVDLRAEAGLLKGAERSAFMRENRDKLVLKGMIDSVDKHIKALNKQRDATEANDSLTDAAKDLKLRQIEAKKKKAVDRFNKRWNKAA